MTRIFEPKLVPLDRYFANMDIGHVYMVKIYSYQIKLKIAMLFIFNLIYSVSKRLVAHSTERGWKFKSSLMGSLLEIFKDFFTDQYNSPYHRQSVYHEMIMHEEGTPSKLGKCSMYLGQYCTN